MATIVLRATKGSPLTNNEVDANFSNINTEVLGILNTLLPLKANLASPTFTGTPAAPTAAVNTNTTQIATTAFVLGQAAASLPLVNGSATIGASTRFARADHVHPTDTTRASVNSPVLTGVPTAPTAAVNTNTAQLATTAFVLGQASNTNPVMSGPVAIGTSPRFARADHVHPTDTTRAPLDSPTLTGTPTAPTAASGTNTTQLATTAFVVGEVSNTVPRTSTTGSAVIPSGTSTQRDSSPQDGFIRYNTELQQFEGYFNGVWQSVGDGVGFAPVQQGGGTGQSDSKLYIGWDDQSSLRVQVDTIDFGSTWPIDVSGSASKLSTARAIELTGDVTGQATFDGSASISITAEVIDNSHAHTIANVTGLQGALDGKAASSHTHSYVPLAGGTMTGNLTVPTVTASNWVRTTAATGWYSETYGGGIHMLDSTWVRVYNGKALLVSNQIAATGNVTAYYSDERLKENIVPIKGALDAVSSLRGVRYNANALAERYGYDRSKQEIGLLAQEVQKVAPEAVERAPFDIDGETGGSLTGENYLTLKYERLVALLVEAVKELRAEVEALKEKTYG